MNTKVISIPIIALFIISGLAGGLLMAAPAVKAAAPAQTITSSATQVTYGQTITLTGSGFTPGLGVSFTFDGITSAWTEYGQTSGAAFLAQDTLLCEGDLCGGSGSTFYAVPDAAGNFQTSFVILDNTGGALTVVATQVITLETQTITLTMEPSISIPGYLSSGFPLETIANLPVTAHGFGNTDPVSFSSSAFYEGIADCTTSVYSAANGPMNGECVSTGNELMVSMTPAGTYEIFASGALSHETAMTGFSVNAYIVLVTTPPCGTCSAITTFSIANGPTPSIYVEGFGFQPGTIPANSIFFQGYIGSTLTKVDAAQAPISVDATGTFGSQSYAGSQFTPVSSCNNGALSAWDGLHGYDSSNCQVVVVADTSLPQGLNSITIQGTTFSWQNGNIFFGAPDGVGAGSEFYTNNCHTATAGADGCSPSGAGSSYDEWTSSSWGGPLLASLPGSVGVGVGTTTMWALYCDTATLSSCTSQITGSVSALPDVFGGTPIAVFGVGFVPDSVEPAGELGVTTNLGNQLVHPTCTAFQSNPGLYATAAGSTGSNEWCYNYGNAGDAARPDANGAWYALSTLPEEGFTTSGYSVGNVPTSKPLQVAADGPLTQVASTLFITPWIDLSGASSTECVFHLFSDDGCDPTVGITLNAITPVTGGDESGGVSYNPACLGTRLGAPSTQVSDAEYGWSENGCRAIYSYLAVHGFSDSASKVTVNIAGNVLPLSITTITNGFGAAADFGNPADTLSLPAGSYTVSAVDNAAHPASATTNSVYGAVTFVPVVMAGAQSPSESVPVESLTYTAGQFVTLVSGSGYGIQGLAASTKYDVGVGFGSAYVQITSFTSTAGGWVPNGGVPLTLPSSLTAGAWTFVITNAATGKDVMFGQVISDYGGEWSGPYAPNYSPVHHLDSQYGDLWFFFVGSLSPSPAGVMVGQSISVTAFGLAPDTPYVVAIDQCPNIPLKIPCTATNPATGPTVASFTSTASGGGSFTYTQPMSPGLCYTNAVCGAPPASGDASYELFACTTGEYPGGPCDGIGWVDLLPSATLSVSSGAPGTSVTVTANGLKPGFAFEVYWNYNIQPNGILFSGVPVGTIVANGAGMGTSTFTVPTSTIPGSYSIMIAPPGDTQVVDIELSQPPTFTVISTVEGSSSLSAGAPSQTTVSGNPAVSITYTNTLGTSLTAIAYGIVSNSAGQIVYYTTATLTVAPSGSQTAYLVLAGLPHGTYSVSIFAVSTDNIVVSQSSTASVTV